MPKATQTASAPENYPSQKTLVRYSEILQGENKEGLISLLEAELSNLAELEDQVRKSGPVARDYVFLTQCKTDGVTYARLVTQKTSTSKQKVRGLGRPGSERHRDWERRIQRRESLDEIWTRVDLIRNLLGRMEGKAIAIPQEPEPEPWQQQA